MLYLAHVFGPCIWHLDSCILQEYVGASLKILCFSGCVILLLFYFNGLVVWIHLEDSLKSKI